MVTLITGSDGIIGSALAAQLRAEGKPILATTRRPPTLPDQLHLDLADDPASWPPLPKLDIAYLCAAASKLDACEDDPQATRRINVVHMQALAERALAAGAFIVFLSTSQVFDGSKPMRQRKEPPCPANEYGRQKVEFETWLLARESTAALRLTKVVDGKLPVFEKWEQAWARGEAVEAFTDLAFSPLPIEAALAGMRYLGENRKPGLFQLSGSKQVSYYEIAQGLAKKLGVSQGLVKPGSALAAGIRPQFLPRFGTLDCSGMEAIAVTEWDYASK